ncbi:UvrD/REP type DNA helicase [Metarhizium robertsii]|uniref:UvrD/REP type DNA helicase n=1 Tax=Metarhizium robertsii TaxID=568076 RepID=A0A014NE73_9HYPO|nr:UvrD/REP type DNA helicase [Metarhizium robertsii]
MESKSRSERYLLAKSYEDLDDKTEDIKRVLGRAHGTLRQMKWDNIQRYLSRYYPRISDLDIHSLSPRERKYLKNFWSTENHKQAVDDLFEDIKHTSSTQREVSKIHDKVDRRVLQEADVIGITTTGLAKRISTLQRLRCKVVICEEAGEVMEPHMLSALLPPVEHFIQIGDHEQLRPQINNFGLSLESKQGVLYQLDRSQFERLLVGVPGRPKIPVAQLEVQRRMRPAVSMLIRETIYPNIQDHRTTRDLPDVVGMRKNLFWLDHDHLEDGDYFEMHHKSHSNAWEAELVHALVRHIVRQGAYRSSDIAVLTPYTGQLQKLRTAMRNDFEIVLSDRDQDALDKDGFDGTTLSSQEASSESPSTQKKGGSLAKKKLSELLRVATVDNFQGEEAKVVIVSLNRSNEARKVGFLRTTNRINVLLSRAQHGMYLIGNTETYTHVKMWQMVIELMRASDSRYLSPMTSLDTAPREDARRLAFGASRTAATCAWRDATRKACTISFRVRSLASGYTSRLGSLSLGPKARSDPLPNYGRKGSSRMQPQRGGSMLNVSDCRRLYVVQCLVPRRFHAAIFAQGPVANAAERITTRYQKFLTRDVARSAGDRLVRAITTVANSAMEAQTAVCICGETCPEDLCKDCGRRQDAQVDLLEMKTYAEIDVDLAPIVVLGCGHFFTAETLDGLVGMYTAYISNPEGRFTALADISATFAEKIPLCPDCKRPVRQYVTRRYNRIINRAVADESSKRFLVTGKNKLKKVDIELEKLQEELAASHSDFSRSINMLHERRLKAIFENRVLARYTDCDKLRRKIKDLRRRTSERYQPSHKLYEATIYALRKKKSDGLSEKLANLSLENTQKPVERDRRVTLAGEMALLKLDFITLEDKLGVLLALKSATSTQDFQCGRFSAPSCQAVSENLRILYFKLRYRSPA